MSQRWGDICTLEYGKALRDYPAEPSDVDCYRVYGTNGPIGWTSKPLCEHAGVIVGRKGAYRGIHFSHDPFFVIDTAYYLRPKNKYLDLSWAYYKLLTVEINRIDVGAAIPTTNRDSFYAVPVKVPPLSEQQRVASILSAYDDLIENNLRRIKLLEESARLLYEEWFVRLRFPGHEHMRIVKGIPVGWEKERISGLVTRISPGKLYDQETSDSEGSTPVLDQGRTGVIGYHDEEPGVIASPDNPVIVFANHTCYQRILLHPFSAIQNVLPFVPNEVRHRNIFWLHYGTLGQARLAGYKGHWPEFVSKEIHVPPAEIAAKFGDIVRPIHVQMMVLQKQNQKLLQARDILLPKLMSGEIEV